MNYRFLVFSVTVCYFRVLYGAPEEYYLQKTSYGLNFVDPPISDDNDGSYINAGNSTSPHVQTSKQDMKGSNVDTKVSADPVVNVQIHFNEPPPTLTTSSLPPSTDVTTEAVEITTLAPPKISQTMLIIVTISFVIIMLDILFILCCLCLCLFCKPKAQLVPEKDPELGM